MHPKRRSLSIGLLALLLILNSCAYFSEYAQLERRARDSFSRADYDSAVLLLARSLQINPDYEESQLLMADAFLMANRVHTENIEEIKSSGKQFRHDRLVLEYQALIELHNAVRSLPPIRDPDTKALIVYEISDYQDELAAAKQSAAEAHYLAGEKLAASESLDDQKSAAKQFKRALKFVPGFRDAEDKYVETREAGIKRIAIIPFEDLSGTRKRFGAVEELVADEVITSIMRDPSATEFMELISRDQLDRVIEEQKLGLSGLLDEQTAVEVGAILGVHEILTGKITQIVYAPPRTVDRSYSETARVVVREEKYKDEEGKTKTRKIYGDVSARVTHYTRTTSAVIKGSYRIVDVKTSKMIASESFEGKSSFNTEWATYTGDGRALSHRSRMAARRKEQVAPVGAEMVSRAASQLAKNLSATLKIYAR
ncbi:MAG: CsgG/HfaB family protein [Candidatus Marinimicrobia bacterium]|nr:CsgG/HfaB family protein [Candidatus Neomarinimicrobiota bacterium]MCF7851295.1 CsgG/HfaB family protein [Candidatus Neomarinimicrobiota bacterium]MCF7904763.1 CsgG/HfaB family protein [Candidatus Neomarinimicrobiota bacterium]